MKPSIDPASATAATLSTTRQILIALLWLSFYAQWLTVVPIILPDQVATILGAGDPRKEGISGSILAAGAIVAMLVAPLAGALSDRWRSARGRRRPFLVAGVLGSAVALALMIPFGPGASLLLYTLAFLHLQFWWNWGAGAYAGLVPDVVPSAQQSTASAWLNVMTVLGTIGGNLMLVAAYRPSHPAAAVGILILISVVCLAATLRGVPEPPALEPGAPFALGAFLRSFYLPPAQHGNFYWVLATRLFANMGVWSIFTFLLYYMRDVIGVAEPTKVLPLLMGIGAVVAVPASLVGARLSDRFGMVTVVKGTGWTMAIAALCYVAIAFAPSLLLVAPVIVVFSASYGAYQAVDWALALAVLPSRGAAGKDMGIWHVSMVLPQILGPASSGWLISGVTWVSSAPVAYTVAFGIAGAWFTLAAALIGKVKLPHPLARPQRG